MHAALFDGFLGVAWASICLWRQLEIAGEKFSLADIDEAVASYLGRLVWRASYDLAIGLVGAGLYLLERLPAALAHESLCTILRHLEELAMRTEQGVSWFYPPEALNDDYRALFPKGYYNLGLAHGIPGVISFLSRLVSRRIEPERAYKLLEDSLRWLVTQRRPPGEVAQFPEMLAEEGTRISYRLAWCYSDLGIAFAILDAGRNAGVREWLELGRDVALTAALRHEASAASMDSCVCHGRAGQAHLLNRLYQRLREPQLAEASAATFSKLLASRSPGAGICGFPTWTAAGNKSANLWPYNAGLLNGVAGVGLALLSATSTVEPLWDRMLLIDEERRFQ
jgi:lantibiotic modifying enzyme